MNRRLLAIIPFLIVAGPMIARALAAGSLSIDGGDVYDFGKVRSGILEHIFIVRNVGKDDLHIRDVRSSCGCMIVQIDRQLLHPGDSAHLRMNLDVRSRTGSTSKSFTITSDDPLHPHIVVRVKALAVRPVSIRPAGYFIVQEARVGVESDATITIVNTGDSVCTLGQPQLVDGNVRVRFDTLRERKLRGRPRRDQALRGWTLRPGEELPLTLHVTPIQEGAGHGTVVMTTSISDVSRIEIPIYMSQVGPASESVQLRPK